MIRFTDAFGLYDFPNSGLPYVINLGIFAQGQMIPGPFGSPSWWIFNTGFGEADYTKILDAQATWVLNLYFRPLVSATGTQTQVWRDAVFYRFSDSMGKLFELHQKTDGHVELRGSADEVLLTFGPFPVGDWTAIQVKLTSSAWTVRVKGVLAGTGAPNVWRQPDRFTHRWEAGAGLNLANYVLNDGQGSLNNDFLPYPWRVDAVHPFALTSNAWGIHGQTDALKCVYDRLGFPPAEGEYPDGNLGYLTPTSGGQRALFQMTDSLCVGRVLAVGLNAICRPISGGQTIKLIVQENAVHLLGNPALTTRTVQQPGRPDLDDYITYQAISETDPETSTFWTDGGIGRASWGVESDTTDVRVTQIFVERVSTMANLSYDCGGAGNYGF